jgi:hypothetical protein
MTYSIPRRALLSGALALLLAATAQSAWSQTQAPSLFKVVTEKDEIIIGLDAKELRALGGNAGSVARALADKKTLTVWQYTVRKSASGDLQEVPLHQIGLLANQSLRVEPYSSPLPVLPHE